MKAEIILSISIIVVFVGVSAVEPPRFDGVCHRANKSFTEPLSTNKQGTQGRKSAPQYQTKWRVEIICCPHYNKTNESCLPICDPPCQHGTVCASPNNCTCDAGYKQNVQKKRCDPQCPSGCKHGRCTAPDFCTCDFGYVRVTNTTCRPANCKVCIRGQCVADDECRCDDGYHSYGNTGLCLPVCKKPSCVNGFICIAPDECKCFGTLKNITVKGLSENNVKQECVPNFQYWIVILIFIGLAILVGIVFRFRP